MFQPSQVPWSVFSGLPDANCLVQQTHFRWTFQPTDCLSWRTVPIPPLPALLAVVQGSSVLGEPEQRWTLALSEPSDAFFLCFGTGAGRCLLGVPPLP